MKVWTATRTVLDEASQVDAFVQILAQREGHECRRLNSRDDVATALSEVTPDCLVLHHHLAAEEDSPVGDPWALLKLIPGHVRVVYLFYEQDLPAIEDRLRQFAIRTWIVGAVDPATLEQKVLNPESDTEPELLLNQSPVMPSRPGPAPQVVTRTETQVRVEEKIIHRVERVIETRVLPQKLVAFWTPGGFDTATLCAHVAAYLALDPLLQVLGADMDLWAPQLGIRLGVLETTGDPEQLCVSQHIVPEGPAALLTEQLKPALLQADAWHLSLFPGWWLPKAAGAVTEAHAQAVLLALRELSHVVCISTAHAFGEATTRAVLKAAHQIVMPVGPGKAELVHALRYLVELTEQGVNRERFTLVPWGNRRSEELTRDLGLAVTEPVAAPDLRWSDQDVLEALRSRPQKGPLRDYGNGIQAVAEAIFSGVSVERPSRWWRPFRR